MHPKVVMTLLVRDEQDIVRTNIEFHLSQGVDFIIATDNRSVDATTEILKEYESKGLLHYIREEDDDYNQHAWVTRMARLAHSDYGADWIINNDADEFWWPIRGDNLKETFAIVPPEVGLVEAQRYNFVPVNCPDRNTFYNQMIYREIASYNLFGLPLPSKVAHRGSSNVVVGQGNHSVTGLTDAQMAKGLIEILHYPVRNYRQIENKIAKGGAAYEKNYSLPEGVGNTWRTLYNEFKEHSNLQRYFKSSYHDEARLRKRLAVSEITRDLRLAQYMQRMHFGLKEDGPFAIVEGAQKHSHHSSQWSRPSRISSPERLHAIDQRD